MRAVHRRSDVVRVVLALALVMVTGGAARAQTAPGPTLPLGMDLAKVPLGTWSEYKLSVAEMPAFRQRFALVGRGSSTHHVEMVTEGGAGGAKGPGKVTVRLVVDGDSSRRDRVKQAIIQLGDHEPMDMGKEAAATKDQFHPLDPKKLVGRKTIQVAGGRFETRHYREKSADGHTVDVWISDQAPPFGIVKLQGSYARGSGEKAHPLVMELVGRGGDARPTITRPARPFDPAVLIAQMNETMGGPPPAAPRAPAPANPPKPAAPARGK